MSTPLLIEFGMGTSLRRGDYTEAAARGIRDALWHNSINLAELFGKTKEDMALCVVIGVQEPDAVKTEEVASTVAFMLSPRSAGINAQGIVIDAGMGTNYFDDELIKGGPDAERRAS